MADGFLTKTKCDHCGGSPDGGRTMSRFDTPCLCLSCAEAEMTEIRKGNRQVGLS